ncbi:hypothetical protein SKAU_G00302710 [Synaphobranchus kaupii]|uniref:Uncharacterized protein n=1 Tax=Synaphobranchus kaupii TaxID=118154 RepID=A0A9Q1INF4_SYNKA|nr:hypothetical protein SKAU_G00302710 [Synaphobranchus kaupii]
MDEPKGSAFSGARQELQAPRVVSGLVDPDKERCVGDDRHRLKEIPKTQASGQTKIFHQGQFTPWIEGKELNSTAAVNGVCSGPNRSHRAVTGVRGQARRSLPNEQQLCFHRDTGGAGFLLYSPSKNHLFLPDLHVSHHPNGEAKSSVLRSEKASPAYGHSSAKPPSRQASRPCSARESGCSHVERQHVRGVLVSRSRWVPLKEAPPPGAVLTGPGLEAEPWKSSRLGLFHRQNFWRCPGDRQ